MFIELTNTEMDLIVRMFHSPIGGEVRELLNRKFVNRTSFDVDPHVMSFKEGQRSLALVLVAGANAAKVVGNEHLDDVDINNSDYTEG